MYSAYCGLAIMHSLMYKRVADAQYRSKLSNELMMYHMKVRKIFLSFFLHYLEIILSKLYLFLQRTWRNLQKIWRHSSDSYMIYIIHNVEKNIQIKINTMKKNISTLIFLFLFLKPFPGSQTQVSKPHFILLHPISFVSINFVK